MNTTPWKPAKGTAAGPPGSLGWRKRLFIAPPWPSPLSPARRQCSPPPHADRLMPPRAPLYLERPQQAHAPPSTIPTSPASPTPHPCLPRLLLPGPGSDRELPPPMPLSVGHPAGLGPCPQPLGRRMQPSLCRTAPPLQPHPRPAPPPRAADSPGQISAPAYRADTAGLPSPQLELATLLGVCLPLQLGLCALPRGPAPSTGQPVHTVQKVSPISSLPTEWV